MNAGGGLFKHHLSHSIAAVVLGRHVAVARVGSDDGDLAVLVHDDGAFAVRRMASHDPRNSRGREVFHHLFAEVHGVAVDEEGSVDDGLSAVPAWHSVVHQPVSGSLATRVASGLLGPLPIACCKGGYLCLAPGVELGRPLAHVLHPPFLARHGPDVPLVHCAVHEQDVADDGGQLACLEVVEHECALVAGPAGGEEALQHLLVAHVCLFLCTWRSPLHRELHATQFEGSVAAHGLLQHPAETVDASVGRAAVLLQECLG
mmetsp:Transcript_15482/g.60535  ORF Transcript_15482/g.60535 Transcript_15482/m.60535 type:complete len:260 (+) Transcript_15482:257-1036(+)